jgi:hypothetical protein
LPVAVWDVLSWKGLPIKLDITARLTDYIWTVIEPLISLPYSNPTLIYKENLSTFG